MVVLSPAFFGGILLVFWIFYKIVYKAPLFIVIDYFFRTLSITTSFFLSSIMNSLATFVNCKEINNVFYLSNYLNEKCSGEKYEMWKQFFIIPAFIFYILFLPLIAFYYMIKNKKRLLDRIVIQKVSFLMNGYSLETFYW